MNRVGQRQIQAAKTVNLIIFLQIRHPELIMQDPTYRARYIHPCHDSLVITERGFYRFSEGRGGDQIQFLQDFVCGGDFVSAVRELADYAAGCPIWDCIEIEKSTAKPFALPEKESGAFKRVWSYLHIRRKVPAQTVEALFDAGLLYQSTKYGNCVFVSRDCLYAEIVGTGTTRYKGIAVGSEADGYWICGAEEPEHVYVCESVIDAVSLAVLHGENAEQNAYASLGGLKPQAMQRLSGRFPDKCILAVDNDEAGNAFAEKYPLLKRLIPNEKDWNADLQAEQGQKRSESI